MPETQMKIAVILSAYDKMSAQINAAVNKSQAKLASFSKKADQMADKSFKNGQQLIAAGLAVGTPLVMAVKAAQEFETKMVDIRKQMQADTPENVKKMTAQIFELGRQLPLATSEIQDMIAAGLRMGIAEDKIIDYTKQVTKMATAFDMPAGEIADSMGKIANVFKIPIDKVGEFADAINYLDDNTMAKGPELIDVIQRIGQASRYMKPEQAAALASTMLSLGESSETSGSGINKLITVLGAASAQSGKVKAGLDMLGLSAADVQKRFTFDAQGTIIDVFERINKLSKVDQATALNRLFGLEQGPKLAKLVNNVEEYRRQLALVNGQQKGSMDREYQKRIASSAAQWQIFKNKINELWVKVGTSLLPTFNKVIDRLGKWVEKIGNFIDKHPTLVKWLGLTAAAFAGLAIVGGGLSFIVGGVARFFSMASSAAGFLVRGVGFLTKVFRILWLLLRFFPLFRIISLIAAGAILIIKNWQKIKDFFTGLWSWITSTARETWEGVKNIVVGPINWIKEKWEALGNWFKDLWGKIKGWAKDAWSWIKSQFTSPSQQMIDDLKKKQPELEKQIRKSAQTVDDYLPHSPAKKGPLSQLHRVRILETIAQTMQPSKLNGKMNKAMTALVPAGVGRQGAGNNALNFNITLNGGATKQDAKLLTDEIEKRFKQLMNNYNSNQSRVTFS